MSLKASELEAELIDAVCARVRERVPEPQVAACEAFVRQYYHWVPAEDLAQPRSRETSTAPRWPSGAWSQQRSPAGEGQCACLQPREGAETAGSSAQTVVEIVIDDMPFIVDSVTMELSRGARAASTWSSIR